MPSADLVSPRTARGRTPEPVDQFSVFIPNKLGRMHEVVRRLAEHEVHVLALTLLDTTDSTIIRLIVDDPDRARALLQEHGFPFTETTIVAVEINGARRVTKEIACATSFLKNFTCDGGHRPDGVLPADGHVPQEPKRADGTVTKQSAMPSAIILRI